MDITTHRQQQNPKQFNTELRDSYYRTEVIRMRVTPFEKEELARLTAASGEKTLSDYLRKRAFELVPPTVVPEINQDVAREIRRMSVHLHSLALCAQKTLATGQNTPQNYEILWEFSRQLAAYQLDLKGKMIQQEIEQHPCSISKQPN